MNIQRNLFLNKVKEQRKLDSKLILKEKKSRLFFIRKIKCEGGLKNIQTYPRADHIGIIFIRENVSSKLLFEISLFNNGNIMVECSNQKVEKNKLIFMFIAKTYKQLIKKIAILNSKISEFDLQNAL